MTLFILLLHSRGCSQHRTALESYYQVGVWLCGRTLDVLSSVRLMVYRVRWFSLLLWISHASHGGSEQINLLMRLMVLTETEIYHCGRKTCLDMIQFGFISWLASQETASSRLKKHNWLAGSVICDDLNYKSQSAARVRRLLWVQSRVETVRGETSQPCVRGWCLLWPAALKLSVITRQRAKLGLPTL